MRKIIFMVILFSFSFKVLSQNRNNQEVERQKQIEEMLRARDEMLRSLLNDENFYDLEKRMEEMMKRFSDDDFFKNAFPKNGLNNFNIFDSPVIGEYDWVETEKERILKIKVKQIKDKPLDIKIEKGQIKFKGDVEEVSESKNQKKKSISKVHFERSFSIPSDVDQTAPEFENKEGELLIKFKKLKSSKKNGPIKNSNQDERIPIGPDDSDTKI